MSNNKVFVLPRQASGSIVDAPDDHIEVFADDGTGKLSSVDENGLVTKYGLETIPQENILYVGKHGSNSNDGTSVGNAVLTIAYAISLAEADTPGPANGYVIQVVDGGVYAESFTIPSYVTVQALGATIQGNVVCEGYGGLICLVLQAFSGNAFEKKNDNDTGLFRAVNVICSGATVNGIVNSQGELLIDIDALEVVNGNGISNTSSANLAGTVNKLNIDGTGKGIVCNGSGSETSLRMSTVMTLSDWRLLSIRSNERMSVVIFSNRRAERSMASRKPTNLGSRVLPATCWMSST